MRAVPIFLHGTHGPVAQPNEEALQALAADPACARALWQKSKALDRIRKHAEAEAARKLALSCAGCVDLYMQILNNGPANVPSSPALATSPNVPAAPKPGGSLAPAPAPAPAAPADTPPKAAAAAASKRAPPLTLSHALLLAQYSLLGTLHVKNHRAKLRIDRSSARLRCVPRRIHAHGAEHAGAATGAQALRQRCGITPQSNPRRF